MQNKQIRLAARPVGNPKESDFQLTVEEIAPLSTNDVLVEVQELSLDPAMRGWMNAGRSYIRPVQIGEVMRAGGGGKVIASENPKFAVGDIVTGTMNVQQYCHVPEGKGLTKIDTRIAPLSTWLSTLGMPGMTAYFGILDVGALKEGDVVVVSGGAGAVGSVVGQVAKIKGCRVVGIAGGQDKVDYMVNELGFDAGVDYKAGNLHSALRAACPEGIDVLRNRSANDDTCFHTNHSKTSIQYVAAHIVKININTFGTSCAQSRVQIACFVVNTRIKA